VPWLLSDFEEESFNGFQEISGGVLPINDFRTGDQDFVAFASHLLHQDGNLHFTTAADVENIRGIGLFNPESDIGANFLNQPFPDVPGGNELAIDSSEWPSLTANCI